MTEQSLNSIMWPAAGLGICSFAFLDCLFDDDEDDDDVDDNGDDDDSINSNSNNDKDYDACAN